MIRRSTVMPTATPSAPVALAAFALTLTLAACSAGPVPVIKRSPDPAVEAGSAQTRPLPDADEGDALPQARLYPGNGRVIDQGVAGSPSPNLGGSSGEARFNFEGESLHAVIKVILGDVLGQNYVIAPSVQGTVTYATPKPVSPAEALSVLEMILGWNNARLLWSDGRYNIVPADQALAAGVVAPSAAPASSARGFESRVVPLRYISAVEMEKLLKPYARPGAVVTVDPGRNVLTIAGSRTELENYLRTIRIFDVDWMSSMSVGVFPLQSSKANDVVQDLEKVFGEQSKSPVAGMFRFMPLDGANAVLAITSQADYLDDIQQWVERIDGAGEGVRLYSYELKYITARDLAERLGEVFAGSGGGGGSGGSRGGGLSLIPGGQASVIDSGGEFDGGRGGGGGGGLGAGQLSLDQSQGGASSVTLEVGADKVSVAAIDETNSLLVRATAPSWRSIRDVIEKLDTLPLQVHIEAQVVQVDLSGDLEFGVSWFFERAVTDAGLPSAAGRTTWSQLAGSVVPSAPGSSTPSLSWTFLGRNAAAVISALDRVSDVKLLQTPSVMVRNNQEATLNVGDRIPVTSVSVNPVLGNNNSISQVQYIDTGTILKVRPRVTKDGTVFLDLVQEVSAPRGQADANGNVRISTNRMKTSAIVDSGDTVLLAGLISENSSRGSSGFPGLSRIPVIGGLFGRQTNNSGRSEIVILVTPTLVESTKAASDWTDEYGRRFRALAPLREQQAGDSRTDSP